MADIRIKDITTTASASLTGDFLPIDGSTGTRKLSAFSPTFGGNATVTGTLTVSGTSATVGSGTGSIVSKLNGAAGSYKLSIYQSAGVDRWYAGLAAGAEGGSDGGAPYSIVALTDAGAVIDNALLITRAAGGSITTPRPVAISSTTASTTTSSGALVVGNGTSGGLGVGGAANIGGTLTVANTSAQLVLGVDSGSALTYTIRPSQAGGAIQIVQDSATVNRWLSLGGVNNSLVYTESLRITNGGHVAVTNTTASTSTSSGALVVSGGVGVAGAIYAGNVINATVNGGASIIGRNGSASSFTSLVAYSGASDEVKGTLTSSTAGVIIVGSQTNHPLAVYVNNAEVARWDTSANFQTRVTGTAPSLTTNSTMTFELTSNTSLKIFVRGSDGTTRSTTLTLA